MNCKFKFHLRAALQRGAAGPAGSAELGGRCQCGWACRHSRWGAARPADSVGFSSPRFAATISLSQIFMKAKNSRPLIWLTIISHISGPFYRSFIIICILLLFYLLHPNLHRNHSEQINLPQEYRRSTSE